MLATCYNAYRTHRHGSEDSQPMVYCIYTSVYKFETHEDTGPAYKYIHMYGCGYHYM
jgi:hypothetical protein